MKKTAYGIVRVFLGLVFLLSGAGKIADTWSFVHTASQYVPAIFSYVAVMLPPMELLLGLTILLADRVRQAAKIVAGLTLFYTIFYAYGLIFKELRECACFGQLEWFALPPWGLFLRNVLLMAGGLWLGAGYPERIPTTDREVSGQRHGRQILLGIGAVAFTMAGFTLCHPFFRQPDNLAKWLGKARSETPFASLDLQKDKTYALFLFNPECPHCWDASRNIASWQTSGMVDEVIPVTGLAFRPQTRALILPHWGHLFKTVHYISDRQMQQAISGVPGTVLLRNDSLVYIRIGPMPAGDRVRYLDPYLFKKRK